MTAQPKLAEVAKTIARQLGAQNPQAWRRISASRNVSRRDNYFFRFVAPLAETAGWPDNCATQLTRELGAHLLWCFAWRDLDDVLDAPVASPQMVAAAFSSYSEAMGSTLFGEIQPQVIHRTTKLFTVAAEVAARERTEGVAINQAWRRASPFLIIPTQLFSDESEKLRAYREYLNLAGLTHDIHDFLSDIARGVVSPPVKWMREIDKDFPFRPKMVRAWFRRAASELERQIGCCQRTLLAKNPIGAVMILESVDMLKELRDDI